MPEGGSGLDASGIVGREGELESVRALLAEGARTPAALVIEGEPGIGKTTVWEWALAEAEPSHRVLVARPGEGEAALPLAGLVDLFSRVPDEALAGLRAPQRRALRVALLRETPPEDAPAPAVDRLTLSLAVLAALARLAATDPVLVGVDDAQWLDPSTEALLTFAVRRARDLPLRLLLTRRSAAPSGSPLALDRALPDGRLARMRLGPLAPADLDRLVRDRLGVMLSRPATLELHRVSGGNPFYALELARPLGRDEQTGGTNAAPGRRPHQPDEATREPRPASFPVPESLGSLLRARVDRLSTAAREAALLAALAAHPTATELERAAGSVEGLAEAVRAQVLRVAGDRVRFTHPLLASVAADAAMPWERRDAHRRLAAVAADPEERALHVALATDAPDGGTAHELEAAAALAAGRGAPEAAARLAEHAVRLTPAEDADDRRRRLVEAAEHHIAAGDPRRGRALLEDLAAGLPRGRARAEVLWRLSTAVGDDLRTSTALCRRALAEAGDDGALEARVRLRLATYLWLLGHLAESADECREAARLAERAGDDALLAAALGEVAHADLVLGRGGWRAEIDRAVELERSADGFPAYLRPSFQLGVLLTFTDRLDEARPLLAAELARVTAAGDEAARAGVLLRLAELEWRRGNWGEALRHARESRALGRQANIEQEQSMMLSVEALVAAHLGLEDEAREAAREALELAERAGDTMVALRSRGTLGFLELSLGRPEEAHGHLGPAVSRLLELEVGEFSITQVIHNEVEVLAALGRWEEAEALVEVLERTGRAAARSWSLAMAGRGRALVLAGRGSFEAALAAIDGALAEHERLPQPFELGRTRLVRGTIQRRMKRWGEARRTLAAALESFDALGASLWAERAAAELARVGGRAPASPGLTPTERRVAELVAEGGSNPEVAAALFMSVRTVEWNLSKVYAKLGVRSRTELARRLGGGAAGQEAGQERASEPG